MRILIADDDQLGREFLVAILEEFGECDSVEDGDEALAKYFAARRSGRPYDLICLDVIMPGQDGCQVLKQIRETEQDEEWQSCIFIITANETEEVIESSAFHGADNFVAKPCSANLMKRALEQHKLI